MRKVITYGTFDLFHEGHYNLLKRAKALGDYLIVGVNAGSKLAKAKKTGVRILTEDEFNQMIGR